jgi:hypothetical protein
MGTHPCLLLSHRYPGILNCHTASPTRWYNANNNHTELNKPNGAGAPKTQDKTRKHGPQMHAHPRTCMEACAAKTKQVQLVEIQGVKPRKRCIQCGCAHHLQNPNGLALAALNLASLQLQNVPQSLVQMGNTPSCCLLADSSAVTLHDALCSSIIQ